VLTATAAANMSRLNILSAWPKLGSSRQLGVLVTVTTMLSQRLSTDFTKPRSYTAAGRGSLLMPSSSLPSNGWIGSITAGFLALSATSRRQRWKQTITPIWTNVPLPR